MQTNASFRVNSNNELSISLQKNSLIEYKLGQLDSDIKTKISSFVLSFVGGTQKFHFANQVFYLSHEEAASLKNRTISILPFSDSTKSFLKNTFDKLFKEKEIFDDQITQIIDLGRNLDQLQTKSYELLASTTPLTPEELEFIFNAELTIKEALANSKKNPILNTALSDLHQQLMSPLLDKAKKQIKLNVKHLSTSAAADKGKAMQLGLLAMLEKEKKLELIESDKPDKVFLFPSSGVVYKKGDNRSQEEEHLADSLMSLSMEHGTVSFFTFSDLSSQRFEHIFEDSPQKIPTPPIPSTSKQEMAEIIEVAPPFNLQEVDAKPYIEGMLTFDELLNNEALHQNVIQHLNLSSEMKAVLAAELQFLDLHPTNLGIIPLICEKHDFFCDKTFAYQLKSNVEFKEFYTDFLAGNIDENTAVFYSSKDKKIKASAFVPIKDIPNLLPALKSSWEFILFDTDLNLAESNELQIQMKEGKPQSLIPFRSVLLASQWKDKPLDARTLTMLKDKERMKRMRQWVNRADAPIRHFLVNPQIIDTFLKKEIEQEKYTLSYQRAQGNLDVTVKDLRRKFTEDLSQLETHQEFWELLEQELSIAGGKGWFKLYQVQEEETIEEIAYNNNLTVEELIELNPEFKLKDPKHEPYLNIEPQMKLRVKSDLTSQSSSAQKQRQIIASQFFPRLSWKQRDALFERQDQFQKYLFYYQTLQNIHEFSSKSPADIKQLVNIITSRTLPLSTKQRETFMDSIARVEAESNPTNANHLFSNLKTELEKALIPTYFNLVKSMYPLIADVYELNLQLTRENHQTAGLTIGLYSTPLEHTLSQAQKGYGAITKKSAQNLENTILEIKNRNSADFFGELESENEEKGGNLPPNIVH